MASSTVLPDWALIDRYVFRRDDDSFPVDNPTEASCTNSRGDKIRICFQLQEPPQPSHLYLWWPGGTGVCDRFSVVGAHRDAVLLQMAYPIPVPNREHPYDLYDYFIYRAGGGSPSLVRLPSVDGTMEEFRALFETGSFFHHSSQQLRRIEGRDIGILRRGAEDVAVAELQIIRTQEPELHVFFPSASRSSKWAVKKPRIIHGPDLNLECLLSDWYCDTVVPFGSYLCWVDYCQGAILFCKVFDDDPELHYLALPVEFPDYAHPHRRPLADEYMTVGVCEEQGTVKCVKVSRESFGQICKSKHINSFVAISWTLGITDSRELIWKEDAKVKSDDFWRLHGESFPHTGLEYPLVSLTDSGTVYFVMRLKGARIDELGYKYDETFLLSLDMTSLSVKKSFKYIKAQEDLSHEEVMFVKEKYWYFESFIPAEFPKFLKMHGTSEPRQFQGSMILDMAFGPHARKRKHDELVAHAMLESNYAAHLPCSN